MYMLRRLDDFQASADRFQRASTYGFVSALAYAGFSLAAPSFDTSAPAPGEILYTLLILLSFAFAVRATRSMYFDRTADEFITGLWNGGASWAFIITTGYALLRFIVLALMRPLSELVPAVPNPARLAEINPHYIPVLLLSFFGAVLIQRYRSN